MKLLEALGASADLRKLAVQQLTEDRVKKQAAKDMDIELPEGAIEQGVDEFATGRGLTTDDVNHVLEVRGIDVQTMNDFVEAGLLWREVVGQRFRARALPSEDDIDAALEERQTRPQEMLTLAEIALPFAERGEAETEALADDLYRQIARGASFSALASEYSRSGSAERGGLLDPVPADRLPAAFRTQVLLLGPGQVTRPIPISGGLALVKLVSIGRQKLPPIPEDRDPRRPRGAAPAAVQRADPELRAGLSPGTDRRRPDRRAMTPPVALTLGDPAGIGGEIALKAWAALGGRLPFFLIGDGAHMAGLGARLSVPVVAIDAPEAAAEALPRGLPVLHHPLPRPAPPGVPDPANAAAVVAIIARGVEIVRAGARLGALHQPDPQEGAEGRRRLRLSRPHRVSRPPLRRAVAGDDARRAGASRRSGHHPHPARRGARGAHARAPRGRRSASPMPASSPTSASRPRASPSPASTRTPGRGAPSAARRSRSSGPSSTGCAPRAWR